MNRWQSSSCWHWQWYSCSAQRHWEETAVTVTIGPGTRALKTLLDTPGGGEETSMARYLPLCYQRRYGPSFAKQFLMTTATVAWKLAQPQGHPLACIAKELALNALVRRAEALLEEQGTKTDFWVVPGFRV
jgi:hypothetical protein